MRPPEPYLKWVCDETPTSWWHDSADPEELSVGLGRGASGVTTNPVLISAALQKGSHPWKQDLATVLANRLEPEQKAESLIRVAVLDAASRLAPRFSSSGGRDGWVCAQVNPHRAGDRLEMLAMARRFHAWAPNVAVKLPATAAGLDVLEDCVAEGVTVTATVSFTVPQVLAVAERHRRGSARAARAGLAPGRCFAVIMIGRLDDYLREVAADRRAAVAEADIRQAGLAVTKRASALYGDRGYDAVLLIAALRGTYHLTELAGAPVVMSIHPAYQDPLSSGDLPREPRIGCPVPADVIQRLHQIPDFTRAYEPDLMRPEEFITFGATQRTLSQFAEAWKQLESYR